MSPVIIVVLVAVFNLVGVGVVVLVMLNRLNKFKEKKINEHWQWLVDTLGLQVHGGEPKFPDKAFLSWLRTPMRLEGSYRNCLLKIYNYTVSSGKNSTSYSTARIIGENPKNLSFEFHREGMFSKLGKLIGLQDIQTGDMTFDKLLIVKSNDADFIKIALLPEIKEKFITIWEQHKPHGSIRLKDAELHYDEVGTIRNAAVRERFAAIADLMADLHGTIEFYNQKSRSASIAEALVQKD